MSAAANANQQVEPQVILFGHVTQLNARRNTGVITLADGKGELTFNFNHMCPLFQGTSGPQFNVEARRQFRQPCVGDSVVLIADPKSPRQAKVWNLKRAYQQIMASWEAQQKRREQPSPQARPQHQEDAGAKQRAKDWELFNLASGAGGRNSKQAKAAYYASLRPGDQDHNGARA